MITDVDGVIAGFRPPIPITKAATPTLVAGRPHSLLYLAGAPSAASIATGSIGVNGTALTSLPGQIGFDNPTGSSFTYLARFDGQATIAGNLLLCDRLWHAGVQHITNTNTGTFSSVTFPSRDSSGSGDGDGILLGVEVLLATGAGTPTIQVEYTNPSGTANRIGTNTYATVASSVQGAFYPIGRQVGDNGVKSVQSIRLSATWTQGALLLVAYRILAVLPLSAPFVGNTIDALTGGLPRLHNNTVPFLIFIPSTTTASNINGQVIYTQG